MAQSDAVRMPADAALAFRDAIRTARVAILALDPWLTTQPAPVRLVLGRALGWWKHCVLVMEPIVVQSLPPESR